ncbi:MAG: response regulator [Pseudooceanicola sp.]
MDDGSTARSGPPPGRPLQGLTILVVEDSRFASEALRLMCLRSGARIRRADSLRSARRHLKLYRPAVVIVDLGLPDGSGADLIADLARAAPRVEVLIGISGDDGAMDAALAAGADGFLSKPLQSLAAFQEGILRHLSGDHLPTGLRLIQDEIIEPDRLAYRDDMVHIAEVLSDAGEEASLDYVAQFLRGLARSAHDAVLAEAANALHLSRQEGRATRSDVARIAGLVQERLAESRPI